MNNKFFYILVLFFCLSIQYFTAQTFVQWKNSVENISKSDADLGLQTAKNARKFFQKSGNKENQAYFVEVIAKNYQGKAMQDSALYFHLLAVKLYDEAQKPLEKAKIFNEIGRLHRKLNNNENALQYYDNALEIFNQLKDEEGKATIYNESGVVFEQMGNNAEAQKRYKKSLQIQIQRKDSVGIGYSLEFIGYNYLLQNKLKESENYLLQSLKIREILKDEFALCLNYNVLGELYFKKNEWQKAEDYISKSNQLSLKIKYPDIRIHNLELQIKNAKQRGDFQNAFALKEQQLSLKDSLYSLEKEKNIESLHQKYDASEKEKAILLQKTQLAEKELQLKTRNMMIAGLSGFAIILGLLGYLFFYRQKMKIRQQKRENELNIALKTIENKNALDQQRLSISRDLHDNIGSQLTFIISSIDTTKQFFGNENVSLDKRLSMINNFTRETILELRDTIWAMNRSGISIEDLESRISNYINNANIAAQNIQFTFDNQVSDSNNFEFDAKKGMNVYRILQESINNAIKHAEATAITVKLYEENNHFNFEISDNGKGFDLEDKNAGNGLKSMEKRAEEIGGKFKVVSNKEGTTINVVL